MFCTDGKRNSDYASLKKKARTFLLEDKDSRSVFLLDIQGSHMNIEFMKATVLPL